MNIIKFKLKVVLEKKDPMCFFSQLDLTHVFERALRRLDLPIYYTQGFNPRIKMSFGRALKLGVEGQVDVVFYFLEDISCDSLNELLTLQLPQGLNIISVTKEP